LIREAAILAGGLGTRLRSVVADRPKVLADVGGRPFLTWWLDALADAGLEKIVLLTGYLGDQVEAAFGPAYRGMNLVYSRESQPLGTAGALALARPFFQGGPVLAINGDSFFRADLAAYGEWFRAVGASAGLLLARVEDTSRFGRVRIEASGRVAAFDEKAGSTGPGWINAGVYLLAKSFMDRIPQGPGSLERDVFPRFIGQGLYGRPVEAGFLDIGTPESYGLAASFLRAGQ
jgi:NDP-sugar pyrophosphorylase family protein